MIQTTNSPAAEQRVATLPATRGAQEAPHFAAPAREYLTFRLGVEEYGIDILRVQEIRSYETPTRIASAPTFVKGVVNLRGVIVPVVDLRLKMDCQNASYNESTVIIVLNIRDRVVGAVVDSVSDVLELGSTSVKPAPVLEGPADSNCIIGIGCVGVASAQRMLILLDIEALICGDDMGLISESLQ